MDAPTMSSCGAARTSHPAKSKRYCANIRRVRRRGLRHRERGVGRDRRCGGGAPSQQECDHRGAPGLGARAAARFTCA
jgi:hypothetical protein